MDKQLLNDLYEVKKAFETRNKMLNEISSDYTQFMDKDIIKKYERVGKNPKEPKKIAKPKLENVSEHNYYKDQLEKKEEYTPTVDYKKITGMAIILFVPLLLFGLVLLAVDQTFVRIFSFIFLGASVAVPLFYWIITASVKTISEKRRVDKKLKEDTENAKRRDQEIELNKKKAKEQYDADMEAYLIDKKKYEEELKKYKAKVALVNEISEVYENEREKANLQLKAHNEAIRKKADKYLDDSLKSLNTYFPKNYVDSIDRIIRYVEDARADTLKEAIELLVKEDHQRALESEARRARYEAEQAAEDARQTMLAQKGMQQCSQCSKRFDCSNTKDNDGNCRYFKNGNLGIGIDGLKIY